jgi:hypothetical protein
MNILNQINTKEFGNLPRITKILKDVSKYKYYTKLDLKDGYCHLEIAEKDRDFLTFCFQGKKFRFRGCPFGLSWIPSYFQNVMESIIQLDDVYIYIDDIVICGNTQEEVLKKTKEVIDKLTSENFRVNEEKSFLLSQELKLLGRVVSHQTVKPDVEKLMGFDFSAPVTCGKDLRKILGFSLFFSEFVPGYANYTQKLNTFQTKRKVNDADVREDIRKLQYALYHSTSLSEFELDQTRA